MVSAGSQAVQSASDAVLRRMLRAMAWLVGLTGLLAFGLQAWTAREALRLQATQQAEHAAQRMAQAIEHLPAAGPRRESLLQSLFEEQRLQRLDLIDPAGTVLFARQAPVASLGVIGALDLVLRPGALVAEAPVRLRGPEAPAGRLRLEPMSPDGGELIWHAIAQAAPALLVGLGLIAGASVWLLHGMRQSIGQLGLRLAERAAATARKARPAHRSQDEVDSELNRLQGELSRRALELDQLRRSALLDPLTGVHRREPFMAHLAQALEGDGEWPVGTLVLVRVRELPLLNRHMGHDRCDELLKSLAQRLESLLAGDQSEGGMVGRLNGSDFALLLPGMSAASHKGRLALNTGRTLFESLDAPSGLVVSAVDLTVGMAVPYALSLADESLVEALAGPRFALVVGRQPRYHVAHGEVRWQQMLADAVAERRVRLSDHAVCDAQGQLMHLDCPLRVQCVPGGAFEGARRWLAPALRAECQADFDLLAIQLALEAIVRDGRPRCTNLSHQAMASTQFIAEVTHALEVRPGAARALWLDLPESLAVDHPALVRQAAKHWGPFGVRLGLKHAGARLAGLITLAELGLTVVRLDGALIAGLRGPDPMPTREHLQGLVDLVHDAGLQVTAEAVTGAADLAAVWGLGFDAATGPAVRLASSSAPEADQSMSPQ